MNYKNYNTIFNDLVAVKYTFNSVPITESVD